MGAVEDLFSGSREVGPGAKKSISGEISGPWEQKLLDLEKAPFILGGLSTEMTRRSAVVRGNPRDTEVCFGVGCVYSTPSSNVNISNGNADAAQCAGVSLGVPVDWLRMYFGAVFLQRLLGLPIKPIWAVIGLDIARHNPAIVAGGHWPPSEELLRIAATHWHVAMAINTWLEGPGKAYAVRKGPGGGETVLLPRIRCDFDAYLQKEDYYNESLQAHQKAARGLRQAVPYSHHQNVLFDAMLRRIRVKTPGASLIKFGWAITDNFNQVAELIELHSRLIEGHASDDMKSSPGGCEAVFDFLSAEAAQAIYGGQELGYAYLPAPGALSWLQPAVCPYTTKPLCVDGQVLMHEGKPAHARLLLSQTGWKSTKSLLDRALDMDLVRKASPGQRETLIRCMRSQVDLFDMLRVLAPGAFDDARAMGTYQAVRLAYKDESLRRRLDPTRKSGDTPRDFKELEMQYVLAMGQVLRHGLPQLVDAFGPSEVSINEEVKMLRERRLRHLYEVKQPVSVAARPPAQAATDDARLFA